MLRLCQIIRFTTIVSFESHSDRWKSREMSGLKLFVVRNAFSSNYRLASIDNQNVTMVDGDGYNTQWYLTEAPPPHEGYFRLHTPATGDAKSLDVLNDNGFSSKEVRFYTTGDYSGQLWKRDPWGDGTYKLSNNFTGPNVHLDMLTNSYHPYLESGKGSAPRWIFEEADGEATSAVTSSLQAVATSVLPAGTQTLSTSSTSAAPTPMVSLPASTTPRERATPLGAIIGSAIGGLAALTICICAVIYVLRRKRTKSISASADQYYAPPAVRSSGPPDYAIATSEKQYVSTHVAPQDKQVQNNQESRDIYRAEIGGSAIQHRSEMP